MNASSLATSFLHLFTHARREIVAAPQFTATSHATTKSAPTTSDLRLRSTPLIFVVGCNGPARQQIGRGLEAAGVEVLHLQSTAECLDAAPILRPDLILLDYPLALAENIQAATLRDCAAQSGNPPIIFLGFEHDEQTLARVHTYLNFQQRRLKIAQQVADAAAPVPSAARIFTTSDQGQGSIEATPPTAEVATAPQDLAPVLRLAQWIFQPIAANKQITLQVNAPATGLVAVCDEVRIQRALENLLSNAIKYSPAGSTVTLGASYGNDGLRFWVEDEGPGVPLAEQSGLFEDAEHFLNIQDSEESGDRGLLVCQHIAALHHGKMEMYNRLGGGAHFELRLPSTTLVPVTQPTTDQVTPFTSSAKSRLVTMNLCPPAVA